MPDTKPITVIKIIVLFVIFNRVSFGQNNCGDFYNYEESQKWINEIKQLKVEARKNKIFKRLKCEQESEQK